MKSLRGGHPVMFPKARSAIIEICKTWRKSEISKGVSTYYSHFEENLAKNIQNDLEEYKKAIDALNNRENELKKEIKKDKEKKRTLEEVREKLMRNKAELEKKKKELQNLPQHVKESSGTGLPSNCSRFR